MPNPITTYLKNLFAKKRLIGDNVQLQGVVKADALLNDLVNKKKVPGLAITVVKDGKIHLQKGYGYADMEDKTAINPRKTIFRIASVSKNIAATALAHMVSEGTIDLEASFYDYVPYFPVKKYDFTIRQLASHTAGIRGYRGTEYGLNKCYTIKESIEIFADDALLFEPGTDYFYTSYDWVLISLAMQEASGIPFEEYVQKKVLNPLGMESTFPENSDYKQLASFYSKNRLGFRKAIPVNNYFKLAGGGYLSSSEDIANFGQAYLENKILNKEVLSPFMTSEKVNGKKTYYGLGWQVSEDNKGRQYYGHVGNGVGGYSNFYVYPKQRMVFAILINSTNPNVQDVLDKVVDALISESTQESLV
ncbi:MAG: serine hydrolase domain-containing protein [Maribacter sp.]|uniref:serine hydrolase domain-containing protein n=1 Tax=Maribacter sp. TaxID=1897614 RepID=UPI0032971390